MTCCLAVCILQLHLGSEVIILFPCLCSLTSVSQSPLFHWSSLILYVPHTIVNCLNSRPLLLVGVRESKKQEHQSMVHFLWVRATCNHCGCGVSRSPGNTWTGQADRGASIILIVLPVLPHLINSSG